MTIPSSLTAKHAGMKRVEMMLGIPRKTDADGKMHCLNDRTHQDNLLQDLLMTDRLNHEQVKHHVTQLAELKAVIQRTYHNAMTMDAS